MIKIFFLIYAVLCNKGLKSFIFTDTSIEFIFHPIYSVIYILKCNIRYFVRYKSIFFNIYRIAYKQKPSCLLGLECSIELLVKHKCDGRYLLIYKNKQYVVSQRQVIKQLYEILIIVSLNVLEEHKLLLILKLNVDYEVLKRKTDCTNEVVDVAVAP